MDMLRNSFVKAIALLLSLAEVPTELGHGIFIAY